MWIRSYSLFFGDLTADVQGFLCPENHWSALRGTSSVRYIFHCTFTCPCRVNVTLTYLAKLELHKAAFLQEPASLNHSFSQKRGILNTQALHILSDWPFLFVWEECDFLSSANIHYKTPNWSACCHPVRRYLYGENFFSCHSRVRSRRPAKLQPHTNLMLPNLFPETHFLSPYLDTFQKGHVSRKFPVKVQGSCRCSVLLLNKLRLFFPLPSCWHSPIAPSAPHAHQPISVPTSPTNLPRAFSGTKHLSHDKQEPPPCTQRYLSS